MVSERMKSLCIGDLTVRLPIIQGGMGVGVSLSGLAAAVADQGGIGVIAAAGIGMLEDDGSKKYLEANIRALRDEIRKARERTRGVIGVNIMVALSNFVDMVRTSIEEGMDALFVGAGLPLDLPAYRPAGSRTKLIPIISSAKAARVIIRRWAEKFQCLPDAFVVEGQNAGGHLGFKAEQLGNPAFSLEKIVSEVVSEVGIHEAKYQARIPVIAAGGIYTGEDIFRMIRLGASGVQMATRFVTTEECDASPDFKNTYIQAKKSDIGIIRSPVGMPGRAILNGFIDKVNRGEKIPFSCPYHCIVTCDYKKSPYCIAVALINAQKGRLQGGFAFAGVNAYRARKIVTVKKVFDSLKKGYARSARMYNAQTAAGEA